MFEESSILVVDDQPLTLSTLQAALELDGYQIYLASDGLEALEILRSTDIDLIIADIAMPRMNGYQLYDAVRQETKWIHIPFIFLTARSMDSDIRYAKELGADDYLTKPFQLDDLRASISGKLRRSKYQRRQMPAASVDANQSEEEITIGEIVILPEQHRVEINNEEVRLSVKEFSLLLHLARHKGQVVSLQELCQVTHDFDTDKEEAGSLLYPLVRTLRLKLVEHNIAPRIIQSVRGVGYILS